MKYLSLYLFFVCTAALLFAGCSGDEATPKYNSGKSIVSFNVLGVEDDDESLRSGSTPAEIAVDTVSLDDNLSVVLTLKEDGGESSITRGTPVALGNSVRYRFVAYNSSTGAYMDHADYTAHNYTPALELYAGQSYNLVGYSYNSTTTLPETYPTVTTSTWSTAGTLATLLAVPPGTDLLHWTGVYNNIPSGNQTIPVTFKHKFSQINVQAVVSQIAGATISSLNNVTISPTYYAHMTLYNGNLTQTGTQRTSSVTLASGLGTSTAKTTYAIVYAPSGNFTVSFTISINGTSHNISQTYTQALVSGKKYTLQANFKNPTPSIPDPETLPVGSGKLDGRTCFDVQQTNWNAANGSNRGSLAVRSLEWASFSRSPNTFSLTSAQYTFTPVGTVSNVRFAYVNAATGGMVESITGGNSGNNISGTVTGTVTFRTDLATAGTLKRRDGTSTQTPLKTTVYAIYNDGATNTGTDRAVPLGIFAADQGCCGVFVGSVWTPFMCHNLGADQSLDPFTPVQGLTGNYYNWGGNVARANAYTPAGAISGWTNTENPAGSWTVSGAKGPADPCPAGWRVPNNSQLQGILDSSPITPVGSFYEDPNNFSCGWNVGGTLFLTCAGMRQTYQGSVLYRGGAGSVWSSAPWITSPQGNNTLAMYSTLYLPVSHRLEYAYIARALPVRCVSE